jgi:hypothetical protein
MIRRQYKDVKDELARVAGTAGQSMDSEQIKNYVNLATEELMSEFDFPGVIDRLRFKVTGAKVVLPSDYERIMLMTIDRQPVQMQSPWYEFVGCGLDLAYEFNQDPNNVTDFEWWHQNMGVLDRDDCATFTDVPHDALQPKLRVYGTVNELVCGERPNITIYGYDDQGQWIRSATGNSFVCATGNSGTGNGAEPDNYVDGIQVPINGDTAPFYIDVNQTVREVTAISKPITRGKVHVYAMPILGAGICVGTYAPRDTVPMYRRYHIPGLCTGHTYHVVARCRRRYFPIVEDTDFLILTNLPALKSMIMAVYYLEAAQPDKYAQYKSIAIDLLKKEAKAYIGLQRQKPLITVAEGPLRRDGMYIL